MKSKSSSSSKGTTTIGFGGASSSSTTIGFGASSVPSQPPVVSSQSSDNKRSNQGPVNELSVSLVYNFYAIIVN